MKDVIQFVERILTMNIYIRTLAGKNINVVLDKPRDQITGADIKKAIEEREGIPIELQRIISCGQLWPDLWTEPEMIRELSSKSRDVGFNEVLHLVLKLVPQHLRTFVDKNYQELKIISADLACEISQTTRAKRYSQKNHPDTETYWNILSSHQRAEILQEPKCDSIVSSLSQTDEASSGFQPKDF